MGPLGRQGALHGQQRWRNFFLSLLVHLSSFTTNFDEIIIKKFNFQNFKMGLLMDLLGPPQDPPRSPMGSEKFLVANNIYLKPSHPDYGQKSQKLNSVPPSLLCWPSGQGWKTLTNYQTIHSDLIVFRIRFELNVAIMAKKHKKTRKN